MQVDVRIAQERFCQLKEVGHSFTGVAFDHVWHLWLLVTDPFSEDYEHAMEQLKKASTLAFFRLESFRKAPRTASTLLLWKTSIPCACHVQGSIHGHNAQRHALKTQAS